MKGEGFFAADIKMPTGADKKKQVTLHDLILLENLAGLHFLIIS